MKLLYGRDYRAFITEASIPNSLRTQITEVMYSVHIEDIKENTKQEIRYFDKTLDELAKGKPHENYGFSIS